MQIGCVCNDITNVFLLSTAEFEKGRPRAGIFRPPWLRIRQAWQGIKESVDEAAERYLGRRRELALGVLLPGAHHLTRWLQRLLLK